MKACVGVTTQLAPATSNRVSLLAQTFLVQRWIGGFWLINRMLSIEYRVPHGKVAGFFATYVRTALNAIYRLPFEYSQSKSTSAHLLLLLLPLPSTILAKSSMAPWCLANKSTNQPTNQVNTHSTNTQSRPHMSC